MRSPRRLAPLLSLLLVTVAVSCDEAEKTTAMNEPPAVTDLTGEWMLYSFDGAGVHFDHDVTLIFETDATVRGRAGCNYYGADYDARDDGGLTFTVTALTEMACRGGNPDPMTFDDEFVAALNKAHSYEIVQNVLSVNYDDGEAHTMKFLPRR